MLRRPHTAVRHGGAVGTVSAKLRPRCRFDVYRIVKQTGPSNDVLGDVATGRDAMSFKQPAHADRLVPLEVAELAEPMEERLKIHVAGRNGTLVRQAVDGRVLLELDTPKNEDHFAHGHRKAGAVLAPAGARSLGLPGQGRPFAWRELSPLGL